MLGLGKYNQSGFYIDTQYIPCISFINEGMSIVQGLNVRYDS